MDKIGVVRDHRWASADEQAEQLAPRCRIVVSLGGGRSSLIRSRVEMDDLAKLCRPGTVIELWRAFLLADPKRKRLSGGMRQEFKRALAVLRKRGAQVVDVSEDIGSDKPGAFMAVVDRDIGRSTRGRAAADNLVAARRGRKVLHFTAEQMRDAKAVWRNVKDYPTWADAAKALPEGFTPARAFRLWKGRH